MSHILTKFVTTKKKRYMLRETINDRLESLNTEVKRLKYENQGDNNSIMKLILAENTIKELNKILGKAVDRLRKKKGTL